MDWNYSPPESEHGSDAEYDYTTDAVEDGSEPDEAESMEFDRNLPSAHSYLPGGLVSVQGRSVLEAGWVGCVPCWGHHSVVFPGETVPMIFSDLTHTQQLQTMMRADRLFGLLFFDIGLTQTYGVLCEVIEANQPAQERNLLMRNILSFKARARQRFILLDSPQEEVLLSHRIDMCEIKILPDLLLSDPLKNVRFFNAGRYRSSPNNSLNEMIRRSDALFTPWPHIVYDIFDEQKIIQHIKNYFRELKFENFPSDTISLSFWVGTNLTLSNSERLALFMTDNALLRLYLESCHIRQKNRMLCCVTCMTDICDKDEVFAMSNEGIYSNYCNVGGFIHDIMTVRYVNHVSLQGRPSIKFTWFPGYLWTIASCASCGNHLGWRFNANKKSLKPQEFWGLTRKSLTSKQKDVPKPD